MTAMNPFFDIEEAPSITSIERLLALNIEKMYYCPGDETQITDITSPQSVPHTTAGIFRGQLHSWPLIPKSYRMPADTEADCSMLDQKVTSVKAMSSFHRFCKSAEAQNAAFPSGVANRLSIAQHFGIHTPLLDWTKSIFAAVFFATSEVYTDSDFEKTQKAFLYHITDEQLLDVEFPGEPLLDAGQSALIKPYHIDRRIERQFSVFTYHPLPAKQPRRIPARVYVLDWALIQKLRTLMKGFGFTYDYFFPDYAGIANAVMSNKGLWYG